MKKSDFNPIDGMAVMLDEGLVNVSKMTKKQMIEAIIMLGEELYRAHRSHRKTIELWKQSNAMRTYRGWL